MKPKHLLIMLIICTIFTGNAQEKLPYYEIPEAPETYTEGTVVSRLIDGLGFRYYWATEGLRPDDLNFRPNEEARRSLETIKHIYGLSNMILNSALQKPNSGGNSKEMNFEKLRATTLNNFKTASDIMRKAEDLSDYKIVFQRGEKTSEMPFWNVINGPISDALWHTGQVVSFRRSSGNPFNSKVSVLSGKVRQ